jgi:hypothetical protein
MTAQTIRSTSVRSALLAIIVALVTAPSVLADQARVVSNGDTANLSAYDGRVLRLRQLRRTVPHVRFRPDCERRLQGGEKNRKGAHRFQL